MKKFHDAMKIINAPKGSGATTLLNADGCTLLTDKEAILKKRWAEHFNSVLNRPSSINEDAIDRLPQPQIECNVQLDEFSTEKETRKAVQQLSSVIQVQMQFLQRFIGPGATHGRETDSAVSLYVEEGGYSTRI